MGTPYEEALERLISKIDEKWSDSYKKSIEFVLLNAKILVIHERLMECIL